jgi:hypothetical protein
MDNIIDISPHAKPRLSIIEEHKYLCWCKEYLLNVHDKTVICAKCGKKFEPFEALKRIAKEEKIAKYKQQVLEKDIEAKLIILESIKKEIINKKSQLKRLAIKNAKM